MSTDQADLPLPEDERDVTPGDAGASDTPEGDAAAQTSDASAESGDAPAEETAEPEVQVEGSAGDSSDEAAEVAEEESVADEAGVSELPEAAAAEAEDEDAPKKNWYILKVQVNREDSIRDALIRRVKVEGLEEFFGDIIVPVEEVVEFTKSGKKRTVKRKIYPGYIMVNMVINDETWFLVRETPGIGDFTGSAGKPTPMSREEVNRIIPQEDDVDDTKQPIVAIPYSPGDRVRVKEGYFQNFEGEIESIDEANGRVTVMINIFGRSTPVDLAHWQIESV